MTNDLIINPRSNFVPLRGNKLGKTGVRQGRVNAYSELILLSLFVFTIPTFQTSDLRVEGSNPSARASVYQYWQHYLQLFRVVPTWIPIYQV